MFKKGPKDPIRNPYNNVIFEDFQEYIKKCLRGNAFHMYKVESFSRNWEHSKTPDKYMDIGIRLCLKKVYV